MSQKVYDCIVVGGGISGVTFAHYLKKKVKPYWSWRKIRIPEGNCKQGIFLPNPTSGTSLGLIPATIHILACCLS